MRAARALALLLSALIALAPVSGGAQPSASEPMALAGALKRMRATGVIRLGVREAALPFSARSAAGQPYGYTVDLCQAIVDDLREAVGRPALRVEYRTVTPQDRLPLVESGAIDLECGVTTATAERLARVAFSPAIFYAGTRLLVPRDGAVRSLKDLGGANVVVVRGTANEAALRAAAAAMGAPIRIEVVEDYRAALAALTAAVAAAVAADDVLMAAYLAEHGLQRRFAIVGPLLNYEPYGIAYARGDAQLDAVVRGTFARLAASRELRTLYVRWFERPLPSGVTVGIPMSPQLQRSFQLLGLPLDG